MVKKTVTVVGLGFVGLTTALGFAEYGHRVYGMEIDAEKRKRIAAGQIPFEEPGLGEALSRHLEQNFFPTDCWAEAIHESDCVYFCVGTPCSDNGEADLSQLLDAITSTLAYCTDSKFRVLTVKSTVPPCTTRDRVIPFIREKGFAVPEQIGVANNPEFLREGHCWEDFLHTDRIVLGVEDEQSRRLLEQLYAPAERPIRTVSYNTGEFIKYLSNSSLAALISFANEMSLAADAFGDIQIAEAFRILQLDARWQSGSIRNYLYPSCGYGGYCLPKDTQALRAASAAKGFTPLILDSVIRTNEAMPQKAAERIMQATQNNPKACVGILGLSFNPGSDDVREAVSAKIIACLQAHGYNRIVAYDPIATENFHRVYPQLAVSCVDSEAQAVEQADVLAIVTRWPAFYGLEQRTQKPIVDCVYML